MFFCYEPELVQFSVQKLKIEPSVENDFSPDYLAVLTVNLFDQKGTFSVLEYVTVKEPQARVGKADISEQIS